MAKFTIKRKYSLESLGDEWKECYLELTPFTIRELNTELLDLTSIDAKDPKSVAKGSSSIMEIIKGHFISGTGIVDGKITEITKEDLEDLPTEILGGILNFLSQGTQQGTGLPSAT